MMTSRRENKRQHPVKTEDNRAKLKLHAPWPDGEARQQMSEEQAERDNLGKHSKNLDWTKKW
jgi:hypothetical protein